MNIYKRQMNDLGLNVEEYSKMLDTPKSIIEKMVNGNGEVVDNMEINNFLRKNIFTKHQEVENNKEEKKVEALNVKLMRGENSYEAKKQWLLEKYPNSKEVLWYVNEYDRDTYFKKYNVKNKADLMRRYKFTCDKGRLKGVNEVGISTIDRLICKSYNELGTHTAYPLICQLYDCFELGHIKEIEKKQNKTHQKREFVGEEKELRNWYNEFDFKGFCEKHDIPTRQMVYDLNISPATAKAIKSKKYKPSIELIKKLQDYVDSFENKFETQTVTMGQAKVFNETITDEDIMKLDNVKIIEELTQEELLRNLLKDRLTEEEKTLIRIFGGRI